MSKKGRFSLFRKKATKSEKTTKSEKIAAPEVIKEKRVLTFEGHDRRRKKGSNPSSSE